MGGGRVAALEVSARRVSQNRDDSQNMRIGWENKKEKKKLYVYYCLISDHRDQPVASPKLRV
jgi:hypothetical protein